MKDGIMSSKRRPIWEREVTPPPYREVMEWRSVTFVSCEEGMRAVVQIARFRIVADVREPIGDESIEVSAADAADLLVHLGTRLPGEERLEPHDVCAARLAEYLQFSTLGGAGRFSG